MRHYELMILVHPDREQQAQELETWLLNTVDNHKGRIHRFENIGRRQLAYSIQKLQKAIYLLFNVECPIELFDEITHELGLKEDVLRTLAIKTDGAPSGQSALMRITQQEREQRTRTRSNFKDSDDSSSDDAGNDVQKKAVNADVSED